MTPGSNSYFVFNSLPNNWWCVLRLRESKRLHKLRDQHPPEERSIRRCSQSGGYGRDGTSFSLSRRSYSWPAKLLLERPTCSFCRRPGIGRHSDYRQLFQQVADYKGSGIIYNFLELQALGWQNIYILERYSKIGAFY